MKKGQDLVWFVVPTMLAASMLFIPVERYTIWGVQNYCELSAEQRSVFRHYINERIKPNSVYLTCASDLQPP
jgi:hypothetical protein